MLAQAKDILCWYDNMRNPVPTWYFKWYYLQHIDGIPFKLKSAFDFSFLKEYGTVFKVFDDQDSGNICFGTEKDGQRCFIKFAGTPAERYGGDPEDAVARLKTTLPITEIWNTRIWLNFEYKLGADIDEVTTIYTLGATAFVLFGDGNRTWEKWQLNDRLFDVAAKAVSDVRSVRQQSIGKLKEEWGTTLAAGKWYGSYIASGIPFSLRRMPARRGDSPHFSAASKGERYFIFALYSLYGPEIS